RTHRAAGGSAAGPWVPRARVRARLDHDGRRPAARRGRRAGAARLRPRLAAGRRHDRPRRRLRVGAGGRRAGVAHRHGRPRRAQRLRRLRTVPGGGVVRHRARRGRDPLRRARRRPARPRDRRVRAQRSRRRVRRGRHRGAVPFPRATLLDRPRLLNPVHPTRLARTPACGGGLTRRAAPGRLRAGPAAIAACALALAACAEESSPVRVVPLEPAASALVEGTDQVATVGQRVRDSLAVRVMDRFGNPVPQAEVLFVVAGGGGTMQPPSARTGHDGIARAAWMLGTVAGLQTVRAELSGVEPVLFTAMANPGPPAALERTGGDGQASTAGSTLPTPLAVRVTDTYDNPVSGVAVAWSIAGGGGSIGQASSVTDLAGEAFASLTLGPAPGPNRVLARVDR